MIPNFPQFKNIELSDRTEIESFTKKFPPYSDFNFTSMWCWDLDGEIEISRFNESLLVIFPDYITGEKFFSFIGPNNSDPLLQTILSNTDSLGMDKIIKLLPEPMIQSIDESLYIIQEDRDHFDYILSIEKLRFHDGVQRPLSTRRLMIEKLKKNNKIVVRPIDIQNQSIQQQIRSVFDEWEVERGSSPETTEKLKFAIERLFEMNTCQQIRSFGAYTEDQLVGYSINELTHTEYAVGHFQQANLKIDKQIYALLMQETATSLGEEGCKYINIEQDLGIDGLRKWKTSYQPVFFLKKYKITPKSLVD